MAKLIGTTQFAKAAVFDIRHLDIPSSLGFSHLSRLVAPNQQTLDLTTYYPTTHSPKDMSSIGKLMKQAARMQQQMEQIQQDLAKRTVEATSGGGAVKVTARCDGTLAAIKIDPQAINPADAQLLEDMVITAANQALSQAKEISNGEMGKVTAGFNLPGLT